MSTQNRSSSRWSIVLAGGDGKRIQPYIQKWLGYPLPKQYCTFAGTRSMLQHTWGRANQIVWPRKKVTVVGRTHQQRSDGHFQGQSEEGAFIFQPQNCDTAPGVFLPLTYVKAWAPQSVVMIFPSDHFIFPEDRFVETVRRAVRAVELWPDRMILFGVQPSHLELDYGWISPGGILGWSEGSCIRSVQEFVEKPGSADGLRLMNEGALWNTLVLVANVETLWKAGWECCPEVMEKFEQLRQSIGTPDEGSVLQTIYHDMPNCNFSREVLQPLSKQLGVMELEKVLWSDWGRPERIIETLQALGIRPTFPTEVFKEVKTPANLKEEVEVASTVY
ncbi:MAG: sugar phosphate nucleotidyltransferase [Nitrospirota bacterium]|nr:sugar phosphate nucleotidyltransferase [Nitrospirota bacterium]